MVGIFEEVARKAYSDRTLTPGTRELLLAVAYGAFLDPEGSKDTAVSRAALHLGRDKFGGWRISGLVIDDLPRYQPPEIARPLGSGVAPGCAGPRLRPYAPRPRRPRTEEIFQGRQGTDPVVHAPPSREDSRNRDRVCGAPGKHRVLERDPRTGRIAAVYWFCGRHKSHAERVQAQVGPVNEAAPEPVPNRGGKLPTYFTGDWEKVYRYYAPHWEPPGYGIRADEWPGVEEMSSGGGVRRPRLRVVR